MSLTELQRPTKDELYANLRVVANEIRRMMERWEAASDYINRFDTNDLDTMNVPAGDVRTHMVDMRVLLQEMTSLFQNQSVTPTKDPKAVVDNIRTMLVV